MTTIRPATAADAAAIAEIYAPIVRDTVISFEAEPPTPDEMARRVASTTERYPWLVWDDGEVGGYAYGGLHRAREAYQWCVETSVYVAERCRRQGVARALYDDLLSRLTAQGFLIAYAGITLPNPASVGFHESLGFSPFAVYERIGFKHGAWHDVGWWQKELGPRGGAPTPPSYP